MRDSDVLVGEFIDLNPGKTKAEIAAALGLQVRALDLVLMRLRWHEMVMSNDDGGNLGRAPRRWYPVDHGATPFKHVVVPADQAAPVRPLAPVSVFNLAAGMA